MSDCREPNWPRRNSKAGTRFFPLARTANPQTRRRNSATFQQSTACSKEGRAIFDLRFGAGEKRRFPEASRLPGLDIKERLSSLNAMVEMTEILAVARPETMDHARLEVGDEELAMLAIIGDIAKRRAGVRSVAKLDLCENVGLITVFGIEPVHRPRPAGCAPHAFHPFAAGLVQTECGCGRQVNVRRLLIVHGDAENLTDLFYRDLNSPEGGVQPGARGRLLRGVQINGRQNGAILVDDGVNRTVGDLGFPCSGKSRDQRLAVTQKGLPGFAFKRLIFIVFLFGLPLNLSALADSRAFAAALRASTRQTMQRAQRLSYT